jgi:threonine/homoserine/homoserine lactone efflux protein
VILTLLTILGALALGVVSPGPSFVLVARTAVAVSRRDALAAALGMGVGGVAFAALALLGLQALLAAVSGLYLALKVAGGLYLLYLGVSLWRAAPRALALAPGAIARPAGLRRSFAIGLATQMSNPKTAVVYGSIFAALLPAEPSLTLVAALPPLVFLLEAGWYSVVALVLSSDRPRAAYLRAKTALDRSAGAVMGVLGLRLIFEAGRRAH